MIPKILHYCWFGRGLMPQSQSDFIRHWRELMPDWQVIRWDESNFPVDFCPYTAEAYRQRKWAFVSDVARLKALSEMGGVYMDTDFKLYSSLEPYRDNNAFTGFEWYNEDYEKQDLPLLDSDGFPLVPGTIIPCCGLLAGIIGAEPHNPFIKECLDAYTSLENVCPDSFVIINNLISSHAEKRGFRYQNQLQVLDSITVYPSEIFACEPYHFCEKTVALHCHTAHSWQPLSRRQSFERWLDCHRLLKPYRILSSLLKKNAR